MFKIGLIVMLALDTFAILFMSLGFNGLYAFRYEYDSVFGGNIYYNISVIFELLSIVFLGFAIAANGFSLL